MNAQPQNWKKIYVNFSRVMKDNVTSTYFKVFLTSDRYLDPSYGQPVYHPANKQRYYYFDNMKVLYRP